MKQEKVLLGHLQINVGCWLVWGVAIIKSLAKIIQSPQIVLGGRNNKQFGPTNFQIWKLWRRETLKQVLPE